MGKSMAYLNDIHELFYFLCHITISLFQSHFWLHAEKIMVKKVTHLYWTFPAKSTEIPS